MKTCTKCNIEKISDDFYKHKRMCKDCCREKNKTWRLENKELVKSTSRRSYLKHKEDRREPRRTYASNRRQSDVMFALRSRISSSIKNSMRGKNGKKSIDILGCSFEELKVYLESKFEPWMNWENRGLYNGELNYGWDIDHIVPSSSAKSEDDLIRLNHYTNLQPLCSKVNRDIKKDYCLNNLENSENSDSK
jgi:hypothetical protein